MVDDRVALTQPAVVGAWRSESGGGDVTFDADGSFTATNLLNAVFDPDHREGQRRSGYGKWRLESPLADPSGPQNTVHLGFTTVYDYQQGFATSARAERQRKAVVLVFYIGDPDQGDRYIFVK